MFTLSGGQRRRLQVIRALMPLSDLLILDEPSVGLDIEARRQLWAQIDSLVADGAAVVWVSHDLDEIRRNCTRMIMMRS